MAKSTVGDYTFEEVEPEVQFEEVEAPPPEPTGLFDRLRQYKQQRINEPGLSPTGQTVRSALWGLVPETPGQAAAAGVMSLAGMGAARPVVQGLGRLAAPAVRTLGGILAGGTESAIDTGDPTGGAVRGGAVTAGMEALVPGASKLGRSLPWAKNIIARSDARKLGQTIGEIVPPLKGARTAQDLENLARIYAEGKGKLAGLFQALEQHIGTAPVNVPTLSATPIPLAEALREIAKLGPKGYAGRNANLMTRTASGMDARQLREDVMDEVRNNLGFFGDSPQGQSYLAQYDTARDMYRKGEAIFQMLSPSRMYRESSTASPRLYTPAVQAHVSQNRGPMQQRLGEQDFSKLVNTVTRGGGLGQKDVLVPGGGGPSNALMAWLRGQNTGATQAMRVPIATMLPNLGSQYAGRAPLTAPENVKTLADLLAIMGTGGINE